MTRTGIVAWNTFREAVRDRVLYNLVFFALLMMATAVLVGQISIGIDSIVIVSLGLSAVSVIGLLMAVFIGVGLVYKEMDKRTLYALLAQPIRRWERSEEHTSELQSPCKLVCRPLLAKKKKTIY